jgi:hypothetical protein
MWMVNFNAAAAAAATSYNNYSSSSNNDMLFNYSNGGTTSGSLAVTTTSASTANYYNYNQYQNYEQQQQNAKIRMFCSTCSKDFATSNELNKHMEKYNNQLGEDVASLNIIPLCNYCGQGMQMNGPKHVCTNLATTTFTRTKNNVDWNTTPQHEQPQQQQHQDNFTQETYEAVINFSSDKHKVIVYVEAAAVVGSSSKKLQPEMSSIVSQMSNNSTKKKDEPPPSVYNLRACLCHASSDSKQ